LLQTNKRGEHITSAKMWRRQKLEAKSIAKYTMWRYAAHNFTVS